MSYFWLLILLCSLNWLGSSGIARGVEGRGWSKLNCSEFYTMDRTSQNLPDHSGSEAKSMDLPHLYFPISCQRKNCLKLVAGSAKYWKVTVTEWIKKQGIQLWKYTCECFCRNLTQLSGKYACNEMKDWKNGTKNDKCTHWGWHTDPPPLPPPHDEQQ